MERNKKKGQDLFEDLIAGEIPESTSKAEDFLGHLDKEFSTEESEPSLYVISDSDKDHFDSDEAPPPPVGSKSKVAKIKVAPEKETQKTAADDDTFEDQFVGVEASEIFPSDAAAVRQYTDKTQQLPMADPFDVAIDDEPKPKLMPKNVVDLQDHLKSSNYLEVAQNRVLELEKEVQKLRRDSEQLAAAGKHFKEMTESLKMQVKQAESNYQNMQDIAKEEKKILMQSLEAKEIKISALQERVMDVEQRQGSQYENVRIRERELENRLEIMKSETEALAHSKDEMILDLKKQVQTVHYDLEKYRIQNQKMSTKMENKEELLRRTVKALRIALTMLEGSNLEEE